MKVVCERPTIALCMITRNEEAYIEDSILSALPVVDRVVVMDTGSTDATKEIAGDLGAEVFEIPWPDSFALARNASLQKATEDWILVMDADERLDAAAAPALIRAARSSTVDAYLLTLKNYFYRPNQAIWDQPCAYSPEAYSSRHPAHYHCCHQGIRFFRNQGRYAFTGRLHEYVDVRDDAPSRPLGPTVGVIHHLGFLKNGGTSPEKDARYLRMAELQCHEDPDRSENFLILGMEYLQRRGASRECLDAFLQSRRLSPSDARAWTFAGIVCNRMQWFRLAEEYFDVAANLNPKNALIWEERGDACFNLQEPLPATQHYCRSYRLSPTPRVALKQALVASRLRRPVFPYLRQVVQRLPEAKSKQEISSQILELRKALWVEESHSGGVESLCRMLAPVVRELGRPDLEPFLEQMGRLSIPA